MDLKAIIQRLSEASLPKYWYFIAENDGKCCDMCRRIDGKVFREDDPAIPKLPLHPHCRCTRREATPAEAVNAMEIVIFTKTAPAYAGERFDEVIKKIKHIYRYNIPKPPRMTDNKANWLHMTWMWFFEQGPNPIRFDCNSPESQDIADSYSMKEVKKTFFETGKIPGGWSFEGHKTATGNLAEVEWFIGTYTIKDFKVKDGIATFTVYNKSGWHSGTRLPPTWIQAIKEKTSYEIIDLVTDAPRGQVIKTKILKYFPSVLKIPGINRILDTLPSFGGDWEQYYEIRMEWKK